MATITAKQIQSFVKSEPKRNAIGGGLYLVVRDSATPYWMLRYSSNGKRKEMTIGHYPDLSLADAKADAAIQKREVKSGADPLITRRRIKEQSIRLVDDLFQDWYDNDIAKRLKHPNIPKRVYVKDIKPSIGDMKIEQVNARDIRSIIQSIANERPTIANDSLMYLKQLFRHGIKLDLIANNPASAFTVSDAGGVEASRDRALSFDELKMAFGLFRKHQTKFTRDNYLACALLVTLGVRKSELCCAKWSEFELNNTLWNLPEGRSKTGAAITIPLPKQVLSWLEELKMRACGSDYLFPPRRVSTKLHMGNDTLNRAISKMFGREPGRKKQPPNLMGDMEHFSPHDLRRTFRSLAASNGIAGHVAERCLNHKLKGVEGIYDRHDYLEERREAHAKVAVILEPIIN
ncbi:site-specific integrase [Shewanella eurypsychrophilus]|uniref:Site-specific integrase n=1 Tax=Shewanella eurypsychrophilus TaxID=2593656 RepID=A0ABX6V399_9GAMM|nr:MULTISPECIES: site-specific integrase [Shewanella]QFU20699.1 tyrosine-type recombinase/integrase [Shewanella sp. YLB-09]QFU20979.1 tyrosine-type recombinase/integrase [Shewanella sp. YLB-09]QPG56267.1 site-specific integrase [Shewanella eurypsychrophilus]